MTSSSYLLAGTVAWREGRVSPRVVVANRSVRGITLSTQNCAQAGSCPHRGLGHINTMDCFEAPRMDLNLIFIKVSAAPTGALGPLKVEEP